MFEVYAHTYHGQPVAEPLSATFGAEGGTIGRGAGNTLVLPDPDRYVSRVQARLRVEAGRIWITNVSSANPLFVNDRELDSNEEAEVRDGDELRMGVYALGVRGGAASMDATMVQRQAPIGKAAPAAPSTPESMPPNAEPLRPAPLVADLPPTRPRTPPSPTRPDHAQLPVDPLQLAFGGADVPADPLASLPASTPAPHAVPPAPPAAPSAPAATTPRPPAATTPRPPAATTPRPPAAPEGKRSPSPGAAAGMPSRPASGGLPASLSSRPPDLSGPFADLFGPGTGGAQPGADRGTGSALPPGAGGAAAAKPLEAVWTELEALPRGPSSGTPEESRPAIPVDFNPFAQPSQSARNTDDPLAELSANAVSLDSLANPDKQADDIFAGIAPLHSAVKPVLADPHAGALDPLGGAGVVDPLALFGAEDPLLRTPKVEPARSSIADNVPEIGGFFRPPASMPDPTLPAISEPPPPPVAPAGRGAGAAAPLPGPVSSPPLILPADLDLSPSPGSPRGSAPALPPDLDLSAAAGVKSGPTHPIAPDLALSPTPSPASAQAAAASDAALPRAAPAGPPPVAGGGDSDALLRAFLTGAGIPAANIAGGLTPELMEKIGRVLAAAVQGALDLITARGMVKREVQAVVTMIIARNNNPLKFLPDAESALLQMFVQRIPGFMGPVEAMEDAFADLRAHEVGMIAGMRAALAEVLRRFDPQVLDQRLKQRTLVEAMLPGGRKAKLWDVYADMHEAISREAQDDFQALFGKAFVTAYEEEIERVRKSSKG